jgi:hypothetical protein
VNYTNIQTNTLRLNKQKMNKNIFFFIFLSILSNINSEKLIFQDEFNDFNLKVWKHELTMGGGGNVEITIFKIIFYISLFV